MNQPHRMGALGRITTMSAAALAALVGTNASAVPASIPADGDATKANVDGRYLRVSEDDDGTVALEVATREFMPDHGHGPTVTLVGVAHIGDASYYKGLQRMLDEHDLVLYESVMPRGTGGAGGETDTLRRTTTREALGFIASTVELYRQRSGVYPADLKTLRAFVSSTDPRLADLLDRASTDGWGRPIAYSLASDEGATGEVPIGYLLWSYAADGRAGGDGTAADIAIDKRIGPEPFGWEKTGSLQGDLASALSLSFQLDVIDYARANWVCSDMSIDQVERAMEARGSDFTIVESALGTESLPATFARAALGIVRIADGLFGGGISDMLKVMLIEMLGNDAAIEQSLAQAGPGFAEVIIDDRNQVVVDDLAAVLEERDDIESIAIFYGAGHMADLAERLRDQLGYVGHTGDWLRAIEVDIAHSSISETELRQMRFMMRRMMKQMR